MRHNGSDNLHLVASSPGPCVSVSSIVAAVIQDMTRSLELTARQVVVEWVDRRAGTALTTAKYLATGA